MKNKEEVMPGGGEQGSGSGKQRLFIALPLPSEVKNELCHAQVELQAALGRGKGVRWTKSEHMHLTIKFLGNIHETQVGDLIAATTSACTELPPILLRAEGFGFFPEYRPPRVIWAGVSDGQQRLAKLSSAVAEAVARFIEQDDERDFSAHLTIGRIRGMRGSEIRLLKDAVRDFGARVFGGWTADKVEIVRSETDDSRLKHSTIAEIPLIGKE